MRGEKDTVQQTSNEGREKTFGNVAAFSAHLEQWKKNENSKSYYTMAVHTHYVVIALLLCIVRFAACMFQVAACMFQVSRIGFSCNQASQSIYGFARWNSIP
jgi:hypothetical protein